MDKNSYKLQEEISKARAIYETILLPVFDDDRLFDVLMEKTFTRHGINYLNRLKQGPRLFSYHSSNQFSAILKKIHLELV